MEKEFILDETKAFITVKYDEGSVKKIEEFENYCVENGIEYIVVQVFAGDDVDSIDFGKAERG